MVTSSEVSAAIATRARIVLWRAEGRAKQEVAALAGVSRPTVDLWLRRFDADGVAGLLDRARGAAREQVPARIRARILAASKTGPPVESGLSHWSSREMARVHHPDRERLRVASLRGEAVAKDRDQTAPHRCRARRHARHRTAPHERRART
jgi:hypothetical protein